MDPEISSLVTVDESAGIAVVEVVFDAPWGTYIAVGSSKASQGDKFNYQTGCELAYGRALRKLGRQLVAAGYDKVHEQDKIKCSQIEALERRKAQRVEKVRSVFQVLKGFLDSKEDNGE